MALTFRKTLQNRSFRNGQARQYTSILTHFLTKKLFFILCILSTSIALGQKSEKTIYLVGNKYQIVLESDDQQKIDVLFKNITDGGISMSYTLDAETTQNQLLDKLKEALIKVTETITIRDSLLAEPVTIKKENFTDYQNFLGKVSVDSTNFIKKFKEKLSYTDFKKFEARFESEQTIKLLDSLQFSKDSTNYKIEFIGEKGFNFKDENGLFKSVDSLDNLDGNKRLVFKLLFDEDAFKSKTKIEFTKEHDQTIDYLHKQVFKPGSFKFLDNIVSDTTNVVFSISSDHNPKEKYYTLRICNDEISGCQRTVNLSFDTILETFKKEIKNKSGEDFSEETYEFLYKEVQKRNGSAVIALENKPLLDSISSLTTKIENLETQYSGMLKLSKEIPLYTVERQKRTMWFNKVTKPRLDKSKRKFIPEYATVRFFDNRARDITIVGKIVDEEGNEEEYESVNHKFSVPLGGFTNFNNQFIIEKTKKDTGNVEVLCFYYKDAFNYYPYNEKYNYSVKNAEYRLKAGETIKIEQKRLLNYFTPVVFSDALGLSGNTDNGLVYAEARARIPIWIKNFRYYSFVSALRTDLNVILSNGLENEARTIKIVQENPIGTDSIKLHNFDLIEFSNLNASVSLDFFDIEMKGLSTDISFGAGIRYYRTALTHTEIRNDSIMGSEDLITEDQINTLAPEVNANFQIRPQTNFGADLNIAYSWINMRGSREDTDIFITNKNERGLLRINLDLYSKIDSDNSNGGIFARIGGFYQPNKKDFYPQILVGYATNLSSFVNKFKKDKN